MNPLSIRLLTQQLIAQQFSTPTEVVRYMGAMQAQEYHLYYKEILSLGRRIKYYLPTQNLLSDAEVIICKYKWLIINVNAFVLG